MTLQIGVLGGNTCGGVARGEVWLKLVAVNAVHPISRAWLSTGGTGAQNYDEFADETAITRIVEDNPTSMLAVEMPDRAPESVSAGLTFEASLPTAFERLRALQESGRFEARDDVVAAYRISTPDGSASYGMFCMVDTAEISTSADEPGLVIRNEDVFLEKVQQRAVLNQTLNHLLSPVLLVQNSNVDRLHEALVTACQGDPFVVDVDETGRQHAIWAVPAGPRQDELCELAASGELIVADGNHRSLAAQVGKLPRFLAVVTTPDSVSLLPYHRLVSGSPLSGAALVKALEVAGAVVKTVDVLDTPGEAGAIAVYTDGVVYEVRLPVIDGSFVERLDHARVEKVIFGDLFDMDAGDKRITYVGGGYEPSWLKAAVDRGDADVAVLIAPVTVDDFIAVNLSRLKLPRKSTWFVPKARAGLVLADLR